MLGFVRNFVPHRGLPIGVDFGGRTLRLAQIHAEGNELSLVHADTIDVPPGTIDDPAARSNFFIRALRDSIRSGRFRGRHIAVALPSSLVQVKHVRVGRGSEAEVAAEARALAESQLAGDDGVDWFVRHIVAGDAPGELKSPQQEVVVFASPQDTIAQIIDDASAARVELVGVQVQPSVVVSSFGNFYRRKMDAEAVNLFVDLGATGTRAVVAAPVDIRFVRAMPVSVTTLHERIATAMKMSPVEVAHLRRLTIAQQTGRSNEIAATEPTLSDPQVMLQEQTAIEARRVADELDLCRRYHDSTFPAQPVSRLIFVGGGAKDRLLCSAIAQAMALPAQIGDPLVRFNRASLPSLACVDRREPQPEWAVAIGLSLCGRTVAAI